ncbi:hypothetical protein Tco_1108056 [Tanacetum coccineum]
MGSLQMDDDDDEISNLADLYMYVLCDGWKWQELLLTLIVKVATPLKVNDYRPISCCYVIYKCISKILTKRVIEGIKEVVSDNQSAFIPRRRISYIILITQELMHSYHKKKGPPRCAFKIDIQKTYDTVDWQFLEHILIRFGFHNTMVRWIMACVSSTSFSLSINGNIHGYFKRKRGLRQGDPLSPYLFTLVMEILTLILKRRVREYPVKYLGVPLISSRLLIKDCKVLVEKAKNRIEDDFQRLRRTEKGLKKPKESSNVPGKDGCVRTYFTDRNQPVEATVGATADPNQSGWFEATIEPKGVQGNTKVGSSGGVTLENTQTQTKQIKPRVNFRPFVNEERVANHDIVLPKSAIDSVSNRYANLLVGCFVGISIAFPIVQNYVTNTWGQFGLQNVMKSDNGVFLFKFALKVGLEKVLERGLWMIRNSPIILSKWSPYVSMTPKEVTKVLVWIKLRKIPLVAYSEDGLSLIATQVGKPIMLDAFTSSICNDPWGRISYARALVEISAGTDLKTEVSMAVPNEDGEGYTREVISMEYEWKPPHCRDCKVFGHSHDTCPKIVSISDPNATIKVDHSDGFTKVKRKKNKGRKVDQQPKARNIRFNKPQLKDYRPKQASQAAQGKSDSLKPTSNPFDALNTLSEEDISGSQKPISCKGVKDPNIGVSSRVKKKNLVFSPQLKIHYFDREDTDDANMDVGAECRAFSSTDTQNEDLEFDEEVDEHIFPEGDKFDIRLNVRKISIIKEAYQDMNSFWTSEGLAVVTDVNVSVKRSSYRDNFKEEKTDSMGEPTIEEYMTKTREDYGSGIVRPKIDDKARFELKAQFFKELQDNTFSGSDNEDANEHIEKEVILFYKGLDIHTRQILDSKGAIPCMNAADAKKAIQEMADHSQKWQNGTSTRTRSTDTSDGLAVIQAQLNNLRRNIKKVNKKVYVAQVGCESCIGPHYTKDCPLKEEVKAFEEAFYI